MHRLSHRPGLRATQRFAVQTESLCEVPRGGKRPTALYVSRETWDDGSMTTTLSIWAVGPRNKCVRRITVQDDEVEKIAEAFATVKGKWGK